MDDLHGEVLGVVGGLGPLASAEFLRTVYRCAVWEQEQQAPRVILDSNPAFPDRTTAFLAGREDLVLRPLVRVLDGLVGLGATRLLICCTTAHHLLPRLPAELRARVVSVPEVIVAQLREARGRYLLLCTNATRSLRLLEHEPGWSEVAPHVVLPDAADQDAVHFGVIYRLKQAAEPAAIAPGVGALLEKYGADGFIVGCSEVHLLATHLFPGGSGEGECIDPYFAIAASLAGTGAFPPAWV